MATDPEPERQPLKPPDPAPPVPPQVPWPEPEPDEFDDPREEVVVDIGGEPHTMLIEPDSAWDNAYAGNTEPATDGGT